MKNGRLTPYTGKTKEKYLLLFAVSFLIFFLLILPALIYNKGIFLYYGDYNEQQIPFLKLVHDGVRNGEIGGISWGTDLGVDLLNSYSFGMLGSPFFWLTIPFPSGAVVYLMPIILCLKHSMAAVTSYAYIRRFVKSPNAAFIGALLYAYSGFQLYNVFFSVFHDVTALFPLMLIALEERINSNRRGVFAVAVAMMALVNYFCFTGEVVFVIIYAVVRIFSKDFRVNAKKFFSVLLEAVLGTGIAAFLLVPSALMLMGNYRVSEHAYGYDLVAYSEGVRILRILQSFFMLPDVPARPNLFVSENAKWSSMAGYLPLFSMAGVIAFIKNKKSHWASILILICTGMAFVPILNSSFYMFNSSYYARWFYMPILLMAMMTAYTLDNREISLKPGIRVCAGALLFFAVVGIIPKKDGDEIKWFSLPANPLYFWALLLITAVSLGFVYLIEIQRRNDKKYLKKAVIMTIAAAFICSASIVYYGVSNGPYQHKYIEKTIKGAEKISLEQDGFYRIDLSDNCDNYAMLWGFPSVRCFNSVVTPSIMEFYNTIGVQRDVGSRATPERYALKGLLSVKYYFNEETIEDDSKEKFNIPGFTYYDTQNGFKIYKNDYYVPMGFAYDYYISDDNMEIQPKFNRDKLMMKSILLSDGQIEKYSDIIEQAPDSTYSETREENYLQNCRDRAAESCSSFEESPNGFTAKISLKEDKLVFFSVPYDKGYTAEVNGQKVDVEKVNYGFMAVIVPAGDNNIIKFHYETRGLKLGIMISASCLAVLVLYLLLCRKFAKPDKDAPFTHYYDYETANELYVRETYEKALIGKVQSDEDDEE